MVAHKIQPFGGMVPSADPTNLPDSGAALAQNTWLYAGSLQGLRTPELLYTASAGTSKVFRIPNDDTETIHLSDAIFIEFTNIDADVIRSAVVGDTFDRYYMASPAFAPQYNTFQRIKASGNGKQVVGALNGPFLLGIPQPSAAPGVSSSGGVSSVTEARAYVYTWVSAYGEEGPPSSPTTLTGKIDDTWSVTLTAAAPGDLGTNRNLATTNIYRTVTGSNGVTNFYFVATVPIGTLTYNDTQSDSVIAGNIQLPSTTWTGPPSDLVGMVSMPNGMIAGWRFSAPKEIWFCEPYRPHAWPAQYTVAVDYPVVGLGVVGQTLVVCTESYPFALTGVNPSSITQSRLGSLEPCISRGSILSVQEGVYYASVNGLVLVSQGAVLNLTKAVCSRDKWLSLAPVTTLRAALFNGAYYAWGSSRPAIFYPGSFQSTAFQTVADNSTASQGLIVDNTNPNVGFVTLYNATPLVNAWNDPWSGELFLIRGNSLYFIDMADVPLAYDAYTWTSKQFQTTEKRNMGALRIYFDVPANTPAQNSSPNQSFPLLALQPGMYGLVQVYADEKLVWSREIRTSGELMRLPSGFKSDYWQVSLIAIVTVKSVQLATSVKELAKV